MIRQAFIVLTAILVFGIAVPLVKGFAFLDPLNILAYACIGVLFIVPAAAEVFAKPSPGPAVLARIAGLMAYGWGISALMLLLGILTVNFQSWQNQILTPDPQLLLAALFLGGSACLALIGVTGLLGERYGPRTAKLTVRIGFLVLLLFLTIGYRHSPDAWRFMIYDFLTTASLTRFSFGLAAVLTVLGVSLTVWRLMTLPRLGIQ